MILCIYHIFALSLQNSWKWWLENKSSVGPKTNKQTKVFWCFLLPALSVFFFLVRSSLLPRVRCKSRSLSECAIWTQIYWFVLCWPSTTYLGIDNVPTLPVPCAISSLVINTLWLSPILDLTVVQRNDLFIANNILYCTPPVLSVHHMWCHYCITHQTHTQ